ncbi:fungal chitosanase [Thozetella sp. PMI_491]|nr:fungal chitosanase [Thozetella sp. PMI_491]
MHPESLIPFFLLSSVSALQIPENVKSFYNNLRTSTQCTSPLATGFYNNRFEAGVTSYCGDHLSDYGIVYLQGPNGNLSDMDVDCDGVQGGPQDDGRCHESNTTLSTTAIRDIIRSYSVGIDDLNPHEHSFVVFGNSGTKAGWKTFDPRQYGIQKASLMAVVCGDQMFYGIWGDSNVDQGDLPRVGEVSISLATACYGTGMSAGSGSNTSHGDPDVLYIAFTGSDAVPGAKGANWTAGNFVDFHASLVGLGDKLVQRIKATCSWTGHCEGTTCSTSQDCSDDLICTAGKCSQT